MFLLALTAFLLLALGPAAFAVATGNKAAIRAAAQAFGPDTGIPEQAQTNHPVSLREARVTSDASSPAALAAVSPAIAEGDDLEHINTTADAALCNTTHTGARTHGLPSSASPHLMRGLALGVSHDWAEQPRLLFPRDKRASGPGLSSCTASPRPRCCTARCKPGDAGRRGAPAPPHLPSSSEGLDPRLRGGERTYRRQPRLGGGVGAGLTLR